MESLSALTSFVNFIALAISVWLGWYILTRSFQQQISWLTSLTLWSISGIFINSLLALNPPPIPADVPGWVQFLFPFWDQDVLTHEANGWISGWLVVPAVGFWHHVTMLIRSQRWKFWHKLQTGVVYLVIIAAIFTMRSSPFMYSEESGDPLLLDTLKPGILYSAFLVALALIIILSVINLRKRIENAHSILEKNQLQTLIWATVIAGLTAPISYIAVVVATPLPRVIISILLLISVIMIGFSVGKYSALSDGRILRRDFLYSGVAMGGIALLYSLVIWISVLIFEVPPAAYIFIIVFAFATHSLVDVARRYLDIFFYQKEDRILRQNIRELSAQVGDHRDNETLQLALDLASTTVRATFSLAFLFQNDKNQLVAEYKWNRKVGNVSRNLILADDFQQFEPGHLPPPLEEVILLIPIHILDKQVGSMLFGPPVNSIVYPEIDLDRLMDVSDQIANSIQLVEEETIMLAQAAQSSQSRKISLDKPKSAFMVKNVEDALRNLPDFAYLGDSDLAATQLVAARLPIENCTHLDRGKVVHDLLVEAVDKLRPNSEYSGNAPPREWYPYLILHYAYFEDMLNRDIMSELYLSEGTFNRTRRSAIRSVARVLSDLEASLN